MVRFACCVTSQAAVQMIKRDIKLTVTAGADEKTTDAGLVYIWPLVR